MLPQPPLTTSSHPHLPLKAELRPAKDFPGGGVGWGGGGAEVEIQLSSAEA